MGKELLEAKMRSIDSRVATLERSNDSYMATHGEMNQGIYNKIQELMDEREKLYREYISKYHTVKV